MDEKVCFKCKQSKPLSSFYRTKRSKDGHQPRCKLCMRASYNSSRNKKKDHYNSLKRKRVHHHTNKWRELKEKQGCKFCNEKFGPCLQLHHLDPKEKERDISNLTTGGFSWDRILEEASKGIIVCGNCHVKLHYNLININHGM